MSNLCFPLLSSVALSFVGSSLSVLVWSILPPSCALYMNESGVSKPLVILARHRGITAWKTADLTLIGWVLVNVISNYSSGHRRHDCCIGVLLCTAWWLRDVGVVSIGGVLQPLTRYAVVLICVCGSRKSNTAINAFPSFNYSLRVFAN